MLRIGTFAEITGVTPRLLRHYAAVGVLVPAHSDARTGYRYYTRDQIPILQQMLAYRAAGVPLRAIPNVFGNRQSALTHQRAVLLEERAVIERKLALVDAELAEHVASAAFRVKRTAPAWIASIRRVVPTYDEADGLLAEMRAAFAGHHDARPAAIWHLCRPAEGHIDCEMQMVFARPPGRAAIPVRRAPGELVVSFAHTGLDSDLPTIYHDMIAWSRASHLERKGPLREVYWDGIIDVQLPIVHPPAT